MLKNPEFLSSPPASDDFSVPGPGYTSRLGSWMKKQKTGCWAQWIQGTPPKKNVVQGEVIRVSPARKKGIELGSSSKISEFVSLQIGFFSESRMWIFK